MPCSVGINGFWLVGWFNWIFSCSIGGKNRYNFQLVWLINFFDQPRTRLKRLIKHLRDMSRDCSSRKDYSQELPRFNRKRLEKCSVEKRQLYQPKPVAFETADPNKSR